MNTSIRKFLAEEDGVTALEYGILAAVVAVIIVAFFHGKLSDLFTSLFNSMSESVETATTAPASGSSSG
jgi:pilus assembly protein Flp/PilA